MEDSIEVHAPEHEELNPRDHCQEGEGRVVVVTPWIKKRNRKRSRWESVEDNRELTQESPRKLQKIAKPGHSVS